MRHNESAKLKMISTKKDQISLKEALNRIAELEEKIEKTEKAMITLEESEKEKELILDNLTEFITYYDKELKVLYINKRAVESIGLKSEQVLGLRCHEVFKKFNLPDPKCEPCLVKEAIYSNKPYTGIKRTSNDKFFLERIIPVSSGNGNEKKYIEVELDITHQIQIEQALKESEEKYRRIIENTKDIIYSINPDGVIFFISKQASLLNYSPQQMIGHNFEEFIHPEDLNRVRRKYLKTMETGEEFLASYRLIGKKGRVIYVEDFRKVIWDGNQVIQLTGVLRDITTKHHLENQLRQSQKLEALGTLAGGIAHDFNNILSAIMGYTELVMMDIESNQKAKEKLNEVFKASIRAKDLVNQILTFSSQGDREQKPMNISLVLKEVLKLLRASLPSTIEIQKKIDCKNETIMADPIEIHQVMMNLCTNAAQAMGNNGGVLEVNLLDEEINTENKHEIQDLTSGSYIVLVVSDTGHGIKKDVIEKIFDPYFTTKRKHGGTGLGLSVVHGIVRSHGGSISVKSEVGIGTTFKVYFPKIEFHDDQFERTLEYPVPFGFEKILFVDDEQILINVNKEMLERLGYKVTTRTSSIEALELVKKHPDRFDLVITDQTMPNLTGIALAEEITKIRSDIPIILCTGFSKTMSRKKLQSIGIKEFVMKPVVHKELAATIRRVLDEN